MLTLAEFEALEDRRMVSIRHARFNAGLMATLFYNAHRSEDSDPVEVWDFIPGYGRTPEEAEAERKRKSIKLSIKMEMMSVLGQSAEQAAEKRQALIDRMREDGIEDPEALYRECFPD